MGEVRVESKKMDPINIRSIHILFVPCQSGIPFLNFDFFKIWPWKSRVKGMGEATVQSNNNNNNNNNLYWHNYRSSTSWLNSILQCTVSLGLSQLWLYTLYSRLRIINAWGETKSQCGSNILSTPISLVPCQSALPFLRYNIFKIWPWKSRVKVMGAVTIQSHNVDLASYRLESISIHVNRPSQSWDTDFTIWPWKSKGQGQMAMVLYTYRSWQFYRT